MFPPLSSQQKTMGRTEIPHSSQIQTTTNNGLHSNAWTHTSSTPDPITHATRDGTKTTTLATTHAHCTTTTPPDHYNLCGWLLYGTTRYITTTPQSWMGYTYPTTQHLLLRSGHHRQHTSSVGGSNPLIQQPGELTAITFALMWTYFHITNHNISTAPAQQIVHKATGLPTTTRVWLNKHSTGFDPVRKKHMYLSDTCQPTHNKRNVVKQQRASRFISQTRRRRNQPH